MYAPKHHVGRLTEDSVLKMLKTPGLLFVPGLTCYDCGSPFVTGTLNLNDYPVSTGHVVAEIGASSTIAFASRIRPTRPIQHFRNHLE